LQSYQQPVPPAELGKTPLNTRKSHASTTVSAMVPFVSIGPAEILRTV
jgi:hypothetical protein